MDIDFRLLRQAVALAEHRSFSRAAEALEISQPSLSRGIKELEARVGLPLFDRRRSGHAPTDFGRVFLEHAGHLLAGADDLDREVAQARGLVAGGLSIGFGAYAAELLAPACASRFAAANPGIRLRVRHEVPIAMPRLLRSRALDLAVGESSVLADDDAVEEIASLAPVQGHAIVRAGHPLTRRSRPTVGDLLAYPYAQVVMLPPRVLRPILAARGSAATSTFPAVECASVGMATRIVASSDAFTFASLGMIRTELRDGRLVPILRADWMRTAWSVVRLRGRIPSAAARDMVDVIRQAHDALLREEAALRRGSLDGD
ncbi:MAG: LysR substrate-binding domain-containing protein [Burkholderiales bacterium]